MKCIACIDKNNGIGKNGQLLISIPNDMKYFRETTKDSIVIMGRKTLYSFKDRQPLKNRINIVFTHDKNSILNDYEYKNYNNLYFVSEKSELNKILNNYKNKEVYVIGGEKIYNLLINECDTLLLTVLDKTFDADTFFPDFTKYNFVLSDKSEDFNYEGIKYNFCIYKKQPFIFI